MGLTIKARIPENSGEILKIGRGPEGRFVVPSEETCDCCGEPAAVVAQGETDAYGWEPVLYCANCFAAADGRSNAHLDAIDVEDRQGYFWICEGTQIDGYGSWDNTFYSYRSAVAYLRQISEEAAPYGGLYPGQGVREERDAQALERVKARIARDKREGNFY